MKTLNWTRYSVDPNDFLLINWDNIPIPEGTYLKNKKAYYQSEVHKLSCSLHACITTISNNFSMSFTLEERKTIFEMAMDRWFDTSFWWYMDKATKLLRDYCKEYRGLDLNYYRIHYTQYKQMARAWFSIVCWYRYALGMWKDRSDWIVWEDVEEYWDRTYWHLVSFCINEKGFWFVDNYFPKNKNNSTWVVNLEQMVKKGIIFDHGYIYSYRNPVKKWYNSLTLGEKIGKLRTRKAES
jgi:hypothetical protein